MSRSGEFGESSTQFVFAYIFVRVGIDEGGLINIPSLLGVVAGGFDGGVVGLEVGGEGVCVAVEVFGREFFDDVLGCRRRRVRW